VELSDEEMSAAAALLAGGDTDAVSFAALEAAGVVRNGAMVPYVARLLEVVAEPKLRIVVERYVAERVIADNVWAIERLAVWGSDVRGATELRPVEVVLLPSEIMRAVGLGPRDSPFIDTSLCAPAATFARLEKLIAANDGTAAYAMLAVAGFDEAQQTILIKLMLDRRSSWRASSIWTDDSGERIETVSVLDGGESGLWLTTHELDEGSEQMICLESVPPSTVWHRIVGLMPGASGESEPSNGSVA
jgi:hypothetical protein